MSRGERAEAPAAADAPQLLITTSAMAALRFLPRLISTYVDDMLLLQSAKARRTLIVSANVSEFDARSVEVGQSAEARLATGELVRGRIRYVAPVADEATRTFAVELEVDNGAGKLRAGGTAELLIPAETVLAHRVAPSLLSLDDAEYTDDGGVGPAFVDPVESVDELDVDVVVSAIGQGPNPLLTSATPELELTKWGNIVADEETGKTNMKGIFAGGDIVTGAATVILAMGAGKKAARAIDEYLKTGEW